MIIIKPNFYKDVIILKKIISILLAAVMLFSVGITAFAADEKPNFLALGDSIAAGAGLINARTQVYGAIVSNTNGYNFKNDAISGHTTQAMIKRINEKKVVEDIKEADIISISIGGNNFLMNNLADLINDALEKNDFSKFDEIGENYYTDLDTIITYIKGLNPEAQILLQTLYNPMYISDDLRMVYQEGANRLNSTMVKYLEDHEGAYALVDVGSEFGDDETLIAVDYIHPNSKGHVVIARAVLKTLNELGLGENIKPVYHEIKISTIFDELIYKLRQIMAKIQAIFNK